MVMRKKDEILAAEEEFFQKIWHERHLVLKYKLEHGLTTCDPGIWQAAEAAAKRVRETYGEDISPENDFEWGMMNGKLSALRWISGDEWDFLDT